MCFKIVFLNIVFLINKNCESHYRNRFVNKISIAIFYGMKKILLLLFLCISLVCKAQKHDIREVNWGWSMSKVKDAEKLKILKQDVQRIIYEGTLDNKNFDIDYQFINSKLVRVFYLYEGKHVNMNSYIEDYNDLKKILADKYNNNIYDSTIWKDDLFKDKAEDVGLACSVGHVVFHSRWISNDEKTQVDLVCGGENYTITLGVIYTSIQFQNLIDKRTQEKNLNDF